VSDHSDALSDAGFRRRDPRESPIGGQAHDTYNVPMAAAPLDALLARLPHRPPMRLIEEIIEVTPGSLARTRRVAHPSDWYFDGHFPDAPVIPAIALVEFLAQTGGLAIAPERADGRLSLRVAAFTDFKFPAAAGPGVTLEATARVARHMGRLTRIEGTVTADGLLVAVGAITLAEVTTADSERC
jgi:3-hydroxyacyl-[acyl-carrier-protein] dehydratase